MQDVLSNLIYDEMALGRDLAADAINQHEDGGATYRLSMSIHLPADAAPAPSRKAGLTALLHGGGRVRSGIGTHRCRWSRQSSRRKVGC